MSDDKADNVKRLVERMGFDPAARPSASEGLFKEVLDELQKERDLKAKAALKTQLEEAVKLREEMRRIDNEYKKQSSNFNKQLGKLLNSLEGSLRGRQHTEEPSEGEGQQEGQ